MDHAWPDTNHRSANASMGSSTVIAFISRLRSRVSPSGPTDESMLDPDQEIFDNLRRQKWLLAPVDSPYSRRPAAHRSSTHALAAYARGRDPHTWPPSAPPPHNPRPSRVRTSRTRLRLWRLFLLLLVAYDQIAMPFKLAFEEPKESGEFHLPVAQSIFVYLIDICFWIDMALTFRCTYTTSMEQGGELITDVKLIASRYRAAGFWWDLLALLPLEFFGAMAGHNIRGLVVHIRHCV